MLPRDVSPKVVQPIAWPLAMVLFFALWPLENALVRRLNFRPERTFDLFFWAWVILCLVLVPRALSALGIRVRGRSVERFRADDRGEEGDVGIDRPLCIRRGPWWMIWFVSAFVCSSGVVVLLSPPPHHFPTVASRLLGACLLIGGLLLTRFRTPVISEISKKGIRAPEGLFGRMTFVPWGEITDCEIVHDENIWCDHFILRDRSGRARFVESGSWLPQLRSADRARVLRALRFRFRRKAKPGQGPGSSQAGLPAAAVWDPELDG